MVLGCTVVDSWDSIPWNRSRTEMMIDLCREEMEKFLGFARERQYQHPVLHRLVE